MGLHGSHCADLSAVGGIPDAILLQVRSAAKGPMRTALESFAPDTARVAFETMHGRKIRSGQTLCGWSKDGDAVRGNGPDVKLLVMLGSSKVTIGFKYDKADRESLDIDMMPGDILVLYGPARTWVTAVCGVQTQQGGAQSSFDFAHIWLCDHRPLKRSRPEVYDRLHNPAMPKQGDMSYKWMQYKYEVISSATQQPRVKIFSDLEAGPSQASRRVSLKGAMDQEQEGPRESGSTGRRWRGRGNSGYYQDRVAGA